MLIMKSCNDSTQGKKNYDFIILTVRVIFYIVNCVPGNIITVIIFIWYLIVNVEVKIY